MGPLFDYLARRLRAEAELELQEIGLRPRHVIALTLLRDLGERSQSNLAEALAIDPTNLVGLLNDMEAAGLIERRRSTADRRRHTVALTDAGLRRLAEVEHVLTAVEQRLFAAFDADDQRALYGLLQRAVATVAGGPAEPPA
jgi:DNA-binding MarR family transcriptional regulator